MKKIGITSIIAAVLLMMILTMCVAGFSSGSAGSAASPLIAFASEEEAYAYQYIGSELGVPWDIVLLTDGMKAYEAGEENLSAYNPLLTSLQFCILMEEEMIPVSKDVSGNQTEGDWETKAIASYMGQQAILEYIGVSAEDLTYKDAAGVIAAINEVADAKSTKDVKYVATLTVNPDYEEVLRSFIGLSETNIKFALEVYDTHYLVYLYGYTVSETDIELPEIVQGSVTRQELAQVAISLLGHPYMMGGKSNQVGAPIGPLDCSGYVDWVYTQCFGKVASSGRIPEGVAVSGTAQQWYASAKIEEKDLKVGDLGFLYDPATMRSGQINHVGIYLGTYEGKMYWIHCAGRAYGTADSPTGRVGISRIDVSNDYNPVTDTTFSPAMRNCRFRYFRRPQFAFVGE